MNDAENNEESDIEEFLEGQPQGGALKRSKKKVNPVGANFYGEKFEAFDKVEVLRDLIPAFKGFYYEKRIENMAVTGKEICQRFNDEYAFPQGKTFFPNMTTLKLWRAKWDKDILEQKKNLTSDDTGLTVRPVSVAQVIKTRGENGEIVLGSAADESLEAGARTLGGELLNDAMQMLRDDQEFGELYEDEVLIKRRNYIVNVFGHVTKLVHGKAALLLKASQEKRENASFLMTLLAKATAGKLSDEELGALKTTYAPTAAPQKDELQRV